MPHSSGSSPARAAKWRITPSTVRACLRSDSLGLGDALNDLHVVDVEGADGVPALVGRCIDRAIPRLPLWQASSWTATPSSHGFSSSIQGAQRLGMELDDVIAETIQGMREVAEAIGLGMSE